MFQLKQKLVRTLIVGVMTVGGFTTLAGSAQADDCYAPPRYTYKTVTTYVYEQQAYRDWVTNFDHCGRPVRTTIIRYRTVQVPVVKVVRIRY